jgi:maltooligosyltrehalose trehalohydrolase
MAVFRVWAPGAGKVEVEIDSRPVEMKRGERGWWEAEVEEAGHGTDYAFRLDGGIPLPDPRSMWQPSGVHGPSRVCDHSRFLWTDKNWQTPPLRSAVMYELHVGTFTQEGTFASTIERLDYLVDLGVTHVELMPVNEFPGSRGWGYDGVHIYAPYHPYGGPDGLKRLVDACHAKGLGVILDVVYNHLGPEGCYVQRFGPYYTSRYHTPWGDALNFDGRGADEVRRYVVDNALMWLRDYHMDGLRLDAVHAIIDTSAVHILEQMAKEVGDLEAASGRYMFLIAESDLNDPRIVWGWDIGGYGLDAQWCDDFHHSVHSLITREKNGYYSSFGEMWQLAKAFRHAFVYDGVYSHYRDRAYGRPTEKCSGHNFVTYIQDHDQVGNRAIGDRMSHIAGSDCQKVAAACLFFSPLVPMLFMGEEWAASTPFQYFSDFENEDLRRAVSAGRRREFSHFGWDGADVPDPIDPACFERTKLLWSEVGEGPHGEMLDWYKRLIRLRKETSELANGRLEGVAAAFSEKDKTLVVERGPMTLAANLSDKTRVVEIGQARPKHIILASKKEVQTAPKGVSLPKDSAVILGPEPGAEAKAGGVQV